MPPVWCRCPERAIHKRNFQFYIPFAAGAICCIFFEAFEITLPYKRVIKPKIIQAGKDIPVSFYGSCAGPSVFQLYRANHRDIIGTGCVNCRKMEATVWPDKKVLPFIKDRYVLIQLYVDDKTELPANEQYISKFSGRKISTIGGLNSDIQAARFNTNSQPYYVLLNAANETPLVTPQGADYIITRVSGFLDSGLMTYN